MRLLKTLTVLVGLLLQAVIAMVFLESHRALSIDPMEWWFPWLAYAVGGVIAGILCMVGFNKIDKMFKRRSS